MLNAWPSSSSAPIACSNEWPIHQRSKSYFWLHHIDMAPYWHDANGITLLRPIDSGLLSAILLLPLQDTVGSEPGFKGHTQSNLLWGTFDLLKRLRGEDTLDQGRTVVLECIPYGTLPYILHYFRPEPCDPWSKVVKYKGVAFGTFYNRVAFGTPIVFMVQWECLAWVEVGCLMIWKRSSYEKQSSYAGPYSRR